MFDGIMEQFRLAVGQPVHGGGGEAAAVNSMMAEVDQVWLVLDRVRPGNARVARPLSPEDSAFAVLITGDFRSPMWERLLAGREPLVGARAILIGKPAAIAAARARIRGIAPPGVIAREAERLAKTADFWIAGLPATLPPSAAGPANESRLSVQRFTAAISTRERLEAGLNLYTSSPEMAARLLDQYRQAERDLPSQLRQNGARMAGETGPELIRFVEKMAGAVVADQLGGELRFRVSIEPEELAPLIAARLPAVLAGGWLGTGTGTPPRQAGAGGPRIVIQGLEEGPREIPLNRRE